MFLVRCYLAMLSGGVGIPDGINIRPPHPVATYPGLANNTIITR
jgi:hypothetical protein